jgi:hypothetical protein
MPFIEIDSAALRYDLGGRAMAACNTRTQHA